MSNNVATNTKNEGRCSFSRKALSVATAAVLATTMVPMLPAESAWAGEAASAVTDNQDAWNLAEITYTVKANDYKQYVVSKGDIMAVDSMTAFGEEISSDDYTVLYFKDAGTEGLSDEDTLVTAADSVEGKAGSHPNFEKYQSGDKFYIVVVKTDTIPDGYAPSDGNTWATWKAASGMVYRYDTFTYSEASKTLDGAQAVLVDSKDKAIDSATSTTYTGGGYKLAVTVNGTQLGADDIKSVSQVSGPTVVSTPGSADGFITIPEEAAAGTYSFVVLGEGAYENSTATVTFEVKKVDLSTAEIPTIVKTATGTLYKNDIAISDFKVNGASITADGDFKDALKFVSYKSDKGVVSLDEPTNFNEGEYTFQIAAGEGDKSISGSKTVTVDVVTDEAVMTYGEADADTYFTNKVFNTSKGQKFDASEFKAYTDDSMETEIDAEIVVVDDATGKVVTDCSAAGSYTATVTVATAPDYSIGGSKDFKFTVANKKLTSASPTVAAAVDGAVLKKAASGTNELTYTGEAIEPVVVVKDGKNVLEQGVDYDVEYTDASGKKIDSILTVADGYKMTISFDSVTDNKGNAIPDVVYDIDVNKIDVASAKASAEFFATDGTTPAVPTFVGYTKADCKGDSVQLSAEDVSATYYKATWDKATDDTDKDGVADANEYKKGSAVKASELNVAGMYFADFNVKSTVENVKGSATSVLFQVSEIAGYSDVDANAWYAGAVYDAKDLKYMTGIAGTKLFMPESQITRAEVAQVFFNMAGQSDEDGKFPTQFSDVDPEAWYAQAIAWASQAGVVGGYDGTDVFGTFDNATREQVATMIYRYAKAQGMDVTVEDEAKALSAYKDAGQLTFGKTAMAWCVEQGIFGVGVDTLRPTDNLSRAEMAATAVRVQPEALV